jgi:hypothetical protein
MNFTAALQALARDKVKFVVIGAVACIARGSRYSTSDLDICHERSTDNLKRLTTALAPLHPRLRDLPPDLPSVFDISVLRNGTNFTFITDLGEIDLLGEVPGLGTFEDVSRDATEMDVHGVRCLVASRQALIRAKRAAGRDKDMLVVAELEAIEELERQRG